MGIGLNFVCDCCDYDSGILMLNQGTKLSLESVMYTYVDIYTNETDLKMHASRARQYRQVMADVLGRENSEITYNYFACVCYECKKTYEMLDLLEKKEGVYVGERVFARGSANPIQQMFAFSPHQWSSLLGEEELCLFCNEKAQKITEERLARGLQCPKCRAGNMEIGNEFEIWD